MSESNTQNVESQNQNLLVRRLIDRAALKRRIIASLVLVYYIWILTSAWSMIGLWWWSLEEGLMWSSTIPGRFFPIPAPPGGYWVISNGYLVDQVFYIMFMHCGVWIVWIVLGLLYLFSPYRIDLRLLRDRVGTRLHDRSQNEVR
ncbi:MAG: hypothetical protein KAW94_00050 [Candidatus Thorarchaeota archaeon]|nr:hypothetical protein [Candidatus Thorarchaeota archaeon]